MRLFQLLAIPLIAVMLAAQRAQPVSARRGSSPSLWTAVVARGTVRGDLSEQDHARLRKLVGIQRGADLLIYSAVLAFLRRLLRRVVAAATDVAGDHAADARRWRCSRPNGKTTETSPPGHDGAARLGRWCRSTGRIRSSSGRRSRASSNQSFADLELIVVEDPSASSGRRLLDGIEDPRAAITSSTTERTSLPRQHNRGARGGARPLHLPFRCRRCLRAATRRARAGVPGAHIPTSTSSAALTVLRRASVRDRRRSYPTDHDAILAAMRRFNPIANSTVMFRREVYERFGGWRDSRDCRRRTTSGTAAGRGGARFANLAEPLVRYRLHGHLIKS